MKRNDWILIAVILLIGAGWLGIRTIADSGKASEVIVTVDGVEYGRYSLSKDQIIDINGTNTLRVENGKVRMVSADCANQLCVNQGAISKSGETIVCLPNKVVARVTGSEDADFDSMTN